VYQNLAHRPLRVGCLADCQGKEPLLTSVVVCLTRVVMDGCEKFSPDPEVHRDSRFDEDWASGLDATDTFLFWHRAREDTFT